MMLMSKDGGILHLYDEVEFNRDGAAVSRCGHQAVFIDDHIPAMFKSDEVPEGLAVCKVCKGGHRHEGGV